ncbi:IclR family transcriptional regulator [Piscinibacter sp. XHJ-5]|uniref:IclR family transcriptional regulator n=1 Tax=Piscinibacter sp. XHJ-5 TaxID=3037797 RepID=UPI002452E4B3|nr:IclR family transcriptional regulator [Piscinibacter sp. XHJ-5]
MPSRPKIDDEPVPVEDAAERGQRGIQSVEVGGQLLLALVHTGRPMALKDLARDAGMSPAKAHPYLVSFGKLGLIAQDEGSGRYGLGPLALQLGLISLQQFDPVRLATPVLRELAQELRLTMAVAVWGNRGATIVRIEEAPTAVHVNMRHGTVMSLRGTASGMLFASHLPRERVLAALADEQAAELRQKGQPVPSRLKPAVDAQLESAWEQIRRAGVSRITDGTVAGVSAMAAPVFDDGGEMVLSLTAIGPSAIFDVRWDGTVANALRRSAKALSKLLGAP